MTIKEETENTDNGEYYENTKYYEKFHQMRCIRMGL